jgi:DNA polymerase-3 subunit delta'
MGRKSLANAFAMTLLCERGKSEPCMECHACKQVMTNNHPDLILVTHEKPGSIGVDDIREQINDTIMIRPYSSYYKIYIVDEAEKMTVQAQNALLKTIEEPPSYAIIMLLTTNQEAFLPTILSRCVQLKLKPQTDAVVKSYLMGSLGIKESRADIYAAFARGNLGRAIHLASSEEFQLLYSELLHMLKHLKEMDIMELLFYIKKMKDENLDIYDCLDFMQLWYRDILMYKVTQDINLLIFREEFNTMKEMSASSAYDGIETILKAIDKARIRLDANVNMELAMELMLLVMKEN